LLANGKVLIVGGADSDGAAIADAELYDPALGTFALSDNLTEARLMHTATLLPDGSVLVAGGVGLSGATLTAELYDAATNSFSSTGSIAAMRYFHTANLVNGKVLLAGGFGTSGSLASAEVYDPSSHTFASTGSMATARAGHSAVQLASGKVLVAGGLDADVLASAELYNSAGGSFSATGSMNAPRFVHTATLLGDGKVLVAGGFDGAESVATAELYSPPVATLSVIIDIKPGDSTNTINPKSSGKIPVAILSSASFDASTQVDIPTLTFGHSGDEHSLAMCGIQNVNADGLMDLLCHFDTQASALQTGDTVAVLKGKTKAGVAFQASDTVRILK
jgi:hypothetical protein